MEIYLIRHTTPLVEKGICYGQTDLDVTSDFKKEAMMIKEKLPDFIKDVHSSPLKRCQKLSDYLFPEKKKYYWSELKEIDCGEWEMKGWDNIPKEQLDPWMSDFVSLPFPGGENYLDLYERTTKRFQNILRTGVSSAVVTHGGVIRSILSHITGTPLNESFSAFKIPYSAVVKITMKSEQISHQFID